jgi:RNA polymerase sigma factor (sigma-70 family)
MNAKDMKYINTISKKYARNVQDVDDITSISCEKILKAVNNKPDARNSWLYQIVKRTAFNFYRNQKVMVNIDDAPQGECSLREFRLDFEKMTRRLTPRRKECLRLYCMGYRWTDIAEELGISRQNARTSTMGGVEELRRWYEGRI